MTRFVSLQMISLGSLLIFNHTSAAAAGRSRCIDPGQVNNTVDMFQRSYWDKLSVSRNPQNARTCAQAATEMRGGQNSRSLSPWKYNLNQEDNRFPHEIHFAECLCQGCIINQREDMSYNSVRVFAPLMVLRKTLCPRDPNKYVLKRDFIQVPVACTCVVPSYVK